MACHGDKALDLAIYLLIMQASLVTCVQVQDMQ